jgi:superoxide dismutase
VQLAATWRPPLKREQLIATNSMVLHELFFDALGEQSATDAKLMSAIARNFGSYDRWGSEFIAMSKAQGGGSGWVLLTTRRAMAQAQAIAWIARLTADQATLLAYIDVFWTSGIFALLIIPIALSLRPMKLGAQPVVH